VLRRVEGLRGVEGLEAPPSGAPWSVEGWACFVGGVPLEECPSQKFSPKKSTSNILPINPTNPSSTTRRVKNFSSNFSSQSGWMTRKKIGSKYFQETFPAMHQPILVEKWQNKGGETSGSLKCR